MGSQPAESTKDLIDKAKLTWGKPPLGIHTWDGPWAGNKDNTTTITTTTTWAGCPQAMRLVSLGRDQAAAEVEPARSRLVEKQGKT